jgi:hypothetical protein
MCRCGGSTTIARSAGGPPPPRPATRTDVALRYLGHAALLVKGPATGRVYALRPGATVPCDARDVPRLLASPLFERERA